MMGVCTRSTDSFFDQFVIFAVDQHPVTLGSFKAWCDDHSIGFKELRGCYKGEQEISFIVNAKHLPFIETTGWLEGQESILHLSGMKRTGAAHSFARRAILKYLDGRPDDELGWFNRAYGDVPSKHENWTLDTTDGTYWIVYPYNKEKAA